MQRFCGDGEVQKGEVCDDGNVNSGDGCTATCQIESFPDCGNYQLDAGEECDDGARGSLTCTPRCKIFDGDGYDEGLFVCGDGLLETLSREQCDDGNSVAGDGCSPNCQIEPAQDCGDGILNPETEQCDEGANNNEGPSSCRPNCTLPYCGDGIVDFNEQCDVGQRPKTNCSETCELRNSGAPAPGAVVVPPPVSTDGGPVILSPDQVPPASRTPTGPGIVIFLASGAAAGIGFMRRRQPGSRKK